MESPGQNDRFDVEQQQANGARLESQKFQNQFDRLISWLILVGLGLTLAYGASARTCPPDPGQIVAAPPAQKADRPAAAPATATPDVQNASSPAPPPASTPTARAPCGEEGSILVGMLLAVIIALAALASGTFIGFLFGLPRTLTSAEVREVRQQTAEANTAAGGQQASPGTPGGRGSGSDVNTNLERISDWLTTIIVGVGLTKLQEIPGAIESFGDHLAPYFGFGGKVFGIAGGLYFFIAGFFLSYVGTRVKLSLVFVLSQRTNQGAATLQSQSFRISAASSAVDSSAASPELKRADQDVLSRSLADLKTPDERAAYAGAAAREGKNELAAEILAGIVRERPNDTKILGDYAGVLTLLGQQDRAQDVMATIRTTAPAAELEAQDKVDIGRLRAGLYNGNYDDAIEAGKKLLMRPVADRDPWIHIWLACAYGQKYAALKKERSSPAQAADLAEAKAQAEQEVERALAIDPSLKSYIRTLYNPALVVGDGKYLTSLYPDDAMDRLLADTPPGARPQA